MKKNPFGSEVSGGTAPKKGSPFGEDTSDIAPAEAAARLEQSARKIRGLRSQLGAEGLTLQGTRELIDEIGSALEAAARALRKMGK